MQKRTIDTFYTAKRYFYKMVVSKSYKNTIFHMIYHIETNSTQLVTIEMVFTKNLRKKVIKNKVS